MEQHTPTVLVIDDSPADRATIRRFLAQGAHPAHQLIEAARGEAGLRLWREHRPACVLIDAMLPDMSGLAALATLVEATDGNAPVIMLTGTS
ncbi:MAG: response regulator, partial [Chloroflexales bacterium]|nr:response regulator [Chloroflexales bacterium]